MANGVGAVCCVGRDDGSKSSTSGSGRWYCLKEEEEGQGWEGGGLHLSDLIIGMNQRST